MALFSKELGIDLGTFNTRVAQGGRILLEEPTVAAIVVAEQKMVAWGKEAQDMLGRVPDSIEVTRPMRNGVIADYVVTEAMLRYFISKVCSRLERRPGLESEHHLRVDPPSRRRLRAPRLGPQ